MRCRERRLLAVNVIVFIVGCVARVVGGLNERWVRYVGVGVANGSLADKDLDIGLRRELVAAPALVTVLARAAEALASFGERAAGLS